MVGKARFLVLVVLAVVLAGCVAGTNFRRPDPQSLKIGQSRTSDILRVMGTPYRIGESIMNGEKLQNVQYAYAEGAAALTGGIIPARAIVFSTYNDLLVAQEFISSFPEDSTDFDESEIQGIVKQKTTRSEVLAMLGKPNGEAIYPYAKEKDQRAAIYSFQQTRGTAANMKFHNKMLVVSYGANDIVSNVEYTSNGEAVGERPRARRLETASRPPAAANSRPESTNAAAGMPVTIESHGLAYVIRSFAVSADKKSGNTLITITGSGLDKMSFRAGEKMKRYLPVLCSFVAPDGSRHEPVGGDLVNEETIVFKFGTTKKPEKISLFAEDDRKNKYTFDWKPSPAANTAAPAAAAKGSAGVKIISSGWESENFTAVVAFPDDKKWKLVLKPRFPHPLSGMNDAYVQTALGMALLQSKQRDAAITWLRRAADQNWMDAIMSLALVYGNGPAELINMSESERWFRKAADLGNPEAKTKLEDLLAGKPMPNSVTLSNSYFISFDLIENEK